MITSHVLHFLLSSFSIFFLVNVGTPVKSVFTYEINIQRSCLDLTSFPRFPFRREAAASIYSIPFRSSSRFSRSLPFSYYENSLKLLPPLSLDTHTHALSRSRYFSSRNRGYIGEQKKINNEEKASIREDDMREKQSILLMISEWNPGIAACLALSRFETVARTYPQNQLLSESLWMGLSFFFTNCSWFFYVLTVER